MRSLLLTLLAPASLAAQQATGMFRGNAQHTGVYSGGGANVVGLQWRVPTQSEITSSPLVVNGVVYVGTGDGRLLALDRTTGHTRWTYDAQSPVQSSPALAQGLAFIASRDGAFHAIDATSGKRRWKVTSGPNKPLPWGHESGDRFLSSATIAGSNVIFGSGDGNVYALDRATGAVRWKAPTDGRIRATAAVDAGKVFVGSYDGCAYAFDLATGKRIWKYETLGVTLNSGDFGYDRRSIQSSPAVANGTVYIGARDGLLYALDETNGSLRWKYDHKISWVIGSPAVVDGSMYVGSSDAHFVQALDAATGTERWRTPVGSIEWSSVAVTAKHIVYGDGAGRLHIGDRATGKDLSIFRTGATIHSSPAVDGDLVVFGSDDGSVYAVRVADDVAVQRAVFFDSTYLSISQISNSAEISRYFANRGYQTLNASSLASFLAARIEDRSPSVVVFAIDALPADASRAPYATSLVRRYLDAGGKIVWSGLPPLVWPVEPGKTRSSLLEIKWSAPSELLGVPHDAAIFDARMSRVTDAGRSWGLSTPARVAWGVAPEGVTRVLAIDDWGFAASWVKSYGGAEGTGFVRVPSDDLLGMFLAAEYRPSKSR